MAPLTNTPSNPLIDFVFLYMQLWNLYHEISLCLMDYRNGPVELVEDTAVNWDI